MCLSLDKCTQAGGFEEKHGESNNKPPQNTVCLKEDTGRIAGKLSPLPNFKTIINLPNSKDIKLSLILVCNMSPTIFTKCHKGRYC